MKPERKEDVLSKIFLSESTPDILFKVRPITAMAVDHLRKKGILPKDPYSYMTPPNREEMERWSEEEYEPGLFGCTLVTRAGIELMGFILTSPHPDPKSENILLGSSLIIPIATAPKEIVTNPSSVLTYMCQHNSQFLAPETDEITWMNELSLFRGRRRAFISHSIGEKGLISTKINNYPNDHFGHELLTGIGPRWVFINWCPFLKPTSSSPQIALVDESSLRTFLAIKTTQVVMDYFNLRNISPGAKGDAF